MFHADNHKPRVPPGLGERMSGPAQRVAADRCVNLLARRQTAQLGLVPEQPAGRSR